ncbi:uncharacterized protein [Typha latifolia]|uniref:uncharacterized protein isoform X2 n=1 Tax=Typha latifolia TaxID=4733 RepID=UPI003C2C5593
MESELGELSNLRVTSLEEEEDEEQSEEIEMDDMEDDEGEEGEEGITLGFVEKPKNPQTLLRHLFPSKAGGVPAWLDPVNLPSEKSRTCGLCGEPLQFLLQIYAPIGEKESTFHRTLFVFMCPSMSCLLLDQHEQWKHGEENPRRSVRVFRCQLPRTNQFYSSDPPRHDGTDKPLKAGVSLCCWCGTWKGDKVCSHCRRANYCSEKHQALHWRSGHNSDCHQTIRSLGASSSGLAKSLEMIGVAKKFSSSTLWPEFEISIEDEYIFDSEKSGENNMAISLAPKLNKTDEMIQSMMDQFEGDADKRSWASFQERIAGATEQVLRYFRDPMARPLWPLSIGRPSKADIPSCSYCKGPLCYEFQIMPQLLYYFGVKNDPESLDWATIAVYTCSESCEVSLGYKEEFAWVQLYPAL